MIHLGERDCSLQRNNQKVLEESPSVAIGHTLRNEVTAAAVKAAQHVSYEMREPLSSYLMNLLVSLFHGNEHTCSS